MHHDTALGKMASNRVIKVIDSDFFVLFYLLPQVPGYFRSGAGVYIFGWIYRCACVVGFELKWAQ